MVNLLSQGLMLKVFGNKRIANKILRVEVIITWPFKPVWNLMVEEVWVESSPSFQKMAVQVVSGIFRLLLTQEILPIIFTFNDQQTRITSLFLMPNSKENYNR